MIRFCENCGSPIEPDSSFCSNCGSRINNAPAHQQSKSTQINKQSTVPNLTQNHEHPTTPDQPQAYVPPSPEFTSNYQHPATPPTTHSFQQIATSTPMQYSIPNQQIEADQPKKKHTLAIVVTILILLALVAGTFIVLFITPGILRTPNTPPATTDDIKKPLTEPDNKESKEDTTTIPKETVDPNAIIDDLGKLFNNPKQEESSNVPDFEKYNIIPTLRLGEVFDYTTSCYNDESLLTTGYMQITSYTRSMVTDDILEFGRENSMDIEGYEILKLDFSGTFSDNNALEYGVKPILRTENYWC